VVSATKSSVREGRHPQIGLKVGEEREGGVLYTVGFTQKKRRGRVKLCKKIG